MTGFQSKRRDTSDLLEAEERWEREQGDLLQDFAVAILAVIGLASTFAALGFFAGLMFATHGSLFK